MASGHAAGPASGPAAGGTTWRMLWREGERRLGSTLDARRIVERVSGYDGAELLLHLDEHAPARALPFARGMLDRRAKGEPLQYVIGRWGFRRLDLFVDRRVLIPRPETEVVVDAALAEIRTLASPGSTGSGRAPVVVDLGTGSGAIALSVALEVPGAEVWATDASGEALAVARANLAGLGSSAASHVRLVQGLWFEALPDDLRGRIDVILSNPPYVAAGERLPEEVAGWEPYEALFSGPTGLEAIATIVRAAPAWLARPGRVVVEIAPHQAGPAANLARAAGITNVDVLPDLQGRLRVLVGRVS